MYIIKRTSRFKRDFKVAVKRGLSTEAIREIIKLLASGKKLPDKYRDHTLSGDWSGFRECHIAPNWLLIYHIDEEVLTLTLVRTGSHSDLFK